MLVLVTGRVGLRGGAGVDRARADGGVAVVLLEGVGDPAGGAGDGEDGFPRASGHGGDMGEGGEGEVDVRFGEASQVVVSRRASTTSMRGDPAAVARSRVRGTGARVAVRVEAVAEAAEAFAATEPGADHGRRLPGPVDLVQQGLDPERRPAVEGPADRGQPGRRHRVRVGPDRGGHPGGHRRRGQLVVGQQHQRGVEHADQAGLRVGGGQPAPQPGGDRAGPGGGPGAAAGPRERGRQSTRPAIRDRPAAVTAAGRSSRRSSSPAARAAAITRIRSSGRAVSGRAAWARRPAPRAPSLARQAGPAAGRGTGRSRATRRPPRRCGCRPGR